ncbi:MAG: S8/S53 family peptidase [Anaerolineales bacterium]|jgi:subtilisin family serine protease
MIVKIRSYLCLTLILIFLAACAEPTSTPKAGPTSTSEINRHPAAADYSIVNPHPTLPAKFDSNLGNFFQNDYRSSNLSKLDLTQSLQGLLYSDFDTQTVWPPAEMLPVGFDPKKIMELGKDPGLGIRQLQAEGITGSGVGIAIIDQPMLVDHQEYASQLKLYEEISIDPSTVSQMHGPAVSSIAVGKTVGVAPQADLYFIADWPGTFTGQGNFDYDFSYYAKAVRRILEINQSLPNGHKIRVISISVGWRSDEKGYADMVAAVNEAKKAGIFVVSMSIHDTYGWDMMGMGRNALDNPNDFRSYSIPAMWTGKNFDPKYFSSNYLLIPMDARTTASPTGNKDYVFYGTGGISWTAPYLAGVYALACQIDPKITPEIFWFTALQTGKTTRVEHNGKQISFGVILNPQALIVALQK